MSKSNQSNNIALYRPAVVTIKKPLATNDEMNQELMKLLGDVVPIKSHSKTTVKNTGKIKAVFYNPALNYGTIKVINYDQNIIFRNNTCSVDKDGINYINRNTSSVDIVGNGVVTLGLKTLQVIKDGINYSAEIVDNAVSSVAENFPFLKSMRTPIVRALFPASIIPTIFNFFNNKEEKAKELKLSQVQTYLQEFAESRPEFSRTWYIFVLDSGFYVPDVSKPDKELELSAGLDNQEVSNATDPLDNPGRSVLVSSDISGLQRYKLDPNIVEYTAKISLKQVKDETNFFDNKEFTDLIGNNVFSVYKVRFQPGTGYDKPEIITEQQAIEMYAIYNQSYNGVEANKWRSEIDDFAYNQSVFGYTYLRSSTKKGNINLVVNVIPLVSKESGFSNKVNQGSSGQYSIKLSDLFVTQKNKDIIHSINPKLTSLSTNSSYNPDKSYKIDYKYDSTNGGVLLFTDKSVDYNSAVDAYIKMCRLANDLTNNVSKNGDNSIYDNSTGFEFPLRSVDQETTSGVVEEFYGDTVTSTPGTPFSSDITKDIVNKTWVKPQTYVQHVALIDSITKVSVGERITTTKYWNSRNISSSNMKMIDFKLLYYMMVKYNVVLKKYNDLENDFIQGNGVVKMYPGDFFKVTGDLEKFNIDSPKNTQLNFDDIVNLPIDSKRELINIYENTYFGGWSGFYCTSKTIMSEDVSPYSNTYIDGAVLSDVIRTLKESKKDGKTDSSRVVVESVNTIKNNDVMDISISRQVMGKSQADIVLNDINEKYQYKTGLKSGECLFEPFDEVKIYLPSFDSNLQLSFTGYVSSIESINNSGYHSVHLVCGCPLKKLEVVRTNIKPSLSMDEAQFSIIHPFTVPEEMLRSVDAWVPFMVAQGLSYFSSMLGNCKEESNVYTIESGEGIVNYQVKSPKFYDPLIQYLWFRRSENLSDQDKAKLALKELMNLYSTSRIYLNGKKLSDSTEIPGIEPLTKIYAENSVNNKKEYKKVEYLVYAQRRDCDSIKNRSIVALISGTMQPSFALGTESIPLVFSDYKTNMDFLLETAEKFNFFLYSNRYGIVTFTPPSVDLLNITYKSGNSFNYLDAIKSKDYMYDITFPDILSKQTTISLRESCDDSKLINWLQISGGFVQSKDVDATKSGIATTIIDKPSIIKYGVHSQKQQTILGVSNLQALKVYGMSLMDRQNKNFRSATAESIGRGDTDINRSVYCAVNNTIYLRTGMVMHYAPGQTFTTMSTLNWGRKPLAPITTKVISTDNINEVIDDTQSKIKELFNDNKITSVLANQFIYTLSSIKSDSKYAPYLSMMLFNGYLWDGVSSISFEDLVTNTYSNEAIGGFQLPLDIINKNSLNEFDDIYDATNYIYERNKITTTNDTSIFYGLFEQANKNTIESIYTKTNDIIQTKK